MQDSHFPPCQVLGSGIPDLFWAITVWKFNEGFAGRYSKFCKELAEEGSLGEGGVTREVRSGDLLGGVRLGGMLEGVGSGGEGVLWELAWGIHSWSSLWKFTLGVWSIRSGGSICVFASGLLLLYANPLSEPSQRANPPSEPLKEALSENPGKPLE